MEMRVSGWWWFGSCTGLWSWVGSFSVYAQLLRTIMQFKGLNVLLLSFLNCISISQCRFSPPESSIELQTNVNTNDLSESQLLHCHSDWSDRYPSCVWSHVQSQKLQYALIHGNVTVTKSDSFYGCSLEPTLDVTISSLFNSLPMDLTACPWSC